MSEFLASIHPVAVCFIVCAAKIIEITIQSLKTCMMVAVREPSSQGYERYIFSYTSPNFS